MRGVGRAVPTRTADWRRMGRAVAASVRHPAGATAALVVGPVYLSVFALPGNLGFVELVLTGSLPVARKVVAIVELYPPLSPTYGLVDTVLVFLTCGLVAANVSVAARTAAAGGVEAGSGSVLGAVGGVLGSGCAACGSALAPLLGAGTVAAVLPFGGVGLTVVSIGALLLVLSWTSRNPECEVA